MGKMLTRRGCLLLLIAFLLTIFLVATESYSDRYSSQLRPTISQVALLPHLSQGTQRSKSTYHSIELRITFALPDGYEVLEGKTPYGDIARYLLVKGPTWDSPLVLIPYPGSDPGYRSDAKELLDFAENYRGPTGEVVKIHSSEELIVGKYRVLRQRYSEGERDLSGNFEVNSPFGASNILRYVISDGSGSFVIFRGASYDGNHAQEDKLLRALIESLVFE